MSQYSDHNYYERVRRLTMTAMAPRLPLADLGRRERERLLRRASIIDAGREVFSRKGFNDTTLDDVAIRAELGKGTLYSYFDSKEMLFQGVIEDSFETMKMVGLTAMASGGRFEERLRLFIASLIDYFFRSPASMRLMMSEAHQLRGQNPMLHLMPQLLGAVAEAIAAAQERGELVRGADPMDLAGILMNMMYGRVMGRIYRKLRGQTDWTNPLVSDERLAEAIGTADDASVEKTVLKAADLIFMVFVEGIRAR
jgi:AcrR family transcriptional regulator